MELSRITDIVEIVGAADFVIYIYTTCCIVLCSVYVYDEKRKSEQRVIEKESAYIVREIV